MIVACIITYNDYPLIKNCIESLRSKVGRIICIDGRYTDFPEVDNVYSTDGTLEYLNSIEAVNLHYFKGSEVDKRNFYLMQLNDGDIVLNLDADEVLVGKIPELKTDFGIIDLHDGCSKHIQQRATRLFKYREGIEYRYCHYTLYYKDEIINKLQKVINPGFTFENITDFYIRHDWHLRPDERKYYKEQYYKTLIQKEAGFNK